MDPGTTSTESDVTGTTDVAMPTTQDLVVAPETDDTGGISSSSSTGPVSVTTPSVEQEGLGESGDSMGGGDPMKGGGVKVSQVLGGLVS